MDSSRSKDCRRKKEKAGEGMNKFIVKYIKLYLPKSIIKIALWQRYTNSQLFLGDIIRFTVLIVSVCFNNLDDILVLI